MRLRVTLDIPVQPSFYPGMTLKEIEELEEREFKEHLETLMAHVREHIQSVRVRVDMGK